MSLDFTQEGILRKDDRFKVVFDPGADKREKGVLGQIDPRSAPVLLRLCEVAHGRAHAVSQGCPAPVAQQNSDREGYRRRRTCCSDLPVLQTRGRQTHKCGSTLPAYRDWSGLCKSRPLRRSDRRSQSRKACRSGNANPGQRDHARDSAHSIQCDVSARALQAARDRTPDTAPPNRNSGTSEPTWAASPSRVICWNLQIQLPFKADQRRSRVCRSRAHPPLHRQILLNLDLDLGGKLERDGVPAPPSSTPYSAGPGAHGDRSTVRRTMVFVAGRAATVTRSCSARVW